MWRCVYFGSGMPYDFQPLQSVTGDMLRQRYHHTTDKRLHHTQSEIRRERSKTDRERRSTIALYITKIKHSPRLSFQNFISAG